jgi:hypothetical protein
MTCKPVGNGLVGDGYRFGLAYEEVEPGAPARVIGKFPAANPDSRRSGSAHLLFAVDEDVAGGWTLRANDASDQR